MDRVSTHRATLGKMQNPVRGILHGTAAVAALAGLIFLLVANPGDFSLGLSLAIYGLSLVTMFTLSSLYHAVNWSEEWKKRMRRLDHAAIFLVVAGTFTPFAVVSLEGAWRTMSLASVWLAACVGIALKLTERDVRLARSVTLQSLMGWSAIIPMSRIAQRLGLDTVGLIAVGGALYMLGMIVFLTQRPRLSPRVFSSHELFHLLVVAASAVHFYTVVTRVIPAVA